MVVAHHNILSIYDIVLNRWTHHYALPAPIKMVWRLLMDHENGKYECGILLRNNTVHKVVGRESKNADFTLVLSQKHIVLPGSVNFHALDTKMRDNSKYMFFLLDKKAEKYDVDIEHLNINLA
jgi:hypothetical protein